MPWSFICNHGQQFLLQPCSNFVNRDGSLTNERDKAVGCIRNGLSVTVYGEKHGLPQDLIKTILGGAAGITGCGNIVDMNQVQNSPLLPTTSYCSGTTIALIQANSFVQDMEHLERP